MLDDWPFDDPPDTEVIALDRVLDGGSAVLVVARDEDEPAWQFLDGEHVFEEDACVVLLGEIVQLDPSLMEVAALPVGSHAWRVSASAPWRFAPGEPPATLPRDGGEA
jgi:hypothetical protein